jgi:hypothetical protein
VHNKAKKAGTAPPKAAPTALEEARVEGVARLLLEGKKGDELARGVRALDATFRDMAVQERAQQQHFLEQQQQHQQLYAPVPSAWAPPPHRRSSSVPPSLAAMHANIALPSLPFFQPEARSDAPAQAAPRRPSSVPPFFHAPWDAAAFQPYTGFADAGLPLAADVDLPEADTSLFEPSFFGGGFGGGPAPAPLDLGFAYAPVAPHELPTPVSAALPTPDEVAYGAFAPWAASPAYSSSPEPEPYAHYGHQYAEPRVAPAPEFANPFNAGADAGYYAAESPVDMSKFNPRDFRMSTVDFEF